MKKNHHIIKSNKTELAFDAQTKKIASLFYAQQPENFCPGGEQQLLLRTADAVSDPLLLSKKSELAISGEKLCTIFADKDNSCKADLSIQPSEYGILFSLKVNASDPIWLVEWRLSGFNFEEVIVPALGGQALGENMPEGTTLSYKYPFWWNAQFAIGMKGEGGILLRIMDSSTDMKLLRVGKENNRFTLTLGFEAPAPLESKNLNIEWYLEGFSGGWQAAVDRHREWLETAMNLKPLADKLNYPDWTKDINFILEMWGARRDSEKPMHSFKQMRERLLEWRELHKPRQTLVYIPGFAENGIDSHAPNYNPSEQCGGPTEFKLFVDEAHRLGYRVMIHTNVLAMTFTHARYNQFRQFQVIDCFGREQGWGLDIDGDWLPEPFFAYINPGYTAWGDLMSRIIGDLINTFSIDAVFLDQTLLAFNESRGPNFIEGMRNHIKRLQNDFPHILFAGEGLHEHVLEPFPVVQIHGIDSIAEVHGIEGQVPWRKAHPVSAYLFEKYTRFMAHLLTKHPSHPMFALQEKAYEKLNVIPALCLYNSDQPLNTPETQKMIKRAKSINQNRGKYE